MHIKAIKDIISEEIDDNSLIYGINLSAFEIIFKKMLDMIKIKNCWTILNFYGYDLDIKLNISNYDLDLVDIQSYHTIKMSKKFEKF